MKNVVTLHTQWLKFSYLEVIQTTLSFLMIPTLTVFYVKLIATFGSSIGVFLIVFYKKILQNLEQKFGSKTLLLLTITLLRFVPFCIIYFILLQEPRGDVPFFWYKVKAVLNGGLVYKDFWSYHAPLFSYIITLPVLFWHSSKSIVLFMMLVEATIVFQTYIYYKKSQSDTLLKTILYLVLSAPMIMVLLGGQEDIWFWGLALIMLFYLQNNKKEGFILGTIYASGLVFIKATLVFWLLPLLVFIKNKRDFLLGITVVGVPTLVVMYALVGMLFLMPIQHTSSPMSPNLFSICMPFFGLFSKLENYKIINWIGLVMSIGLSFLLSFKVRNKPLRTLLPLCFIWTFASINLFQISAMGYYAFVYFLPFIFEVIDLKLKRDLSFLLAFNLLLVVEPFVYTYLQNPLFTSFAEVVKSPLYFLQYLLQIFNVFGFVWVIYKTYQKATTA